MKSDQYHVKVTKIERLPDRPDGDFIGLNEGGPICEGYWIKGHCFELPTRGQPFHVDRYERNGTKIIGDFTTSPVQLTSHTDNGDIQFKTENSVYNVQFIS